MEALGGSGFRTSRKNVEADQWARDVARLQEEIDQLKAEHARARADRKAAIKARIDQLNSKLQSKLDQIKQRSEQVKSETDAKLRALKSKAEKTHGDIKAGDDLQFILKNSHDQFFP